MSNKIGLTWNHKVYVCVCMCLCLCVCVCVCVCVRVLGEGAKTMPFLWVYIDYGLYLPNFGRSYRFLFYMLSVTCSYEITTAMTRTVTRLKLVEEQMFWFFGEEFCGEALKKSIFMYHFNCLFQNLEN